MTNRVGFGVPLNGEILRCDDGEWRSLGVVDKREGFTIIDRRKRSVPLDEISKDSEIAPADRDRDFSRGGTPRTPRPVPIPLPVITDCHGS